MRIDRRIERKKRNRKKLIGFFLAGILLLMLPLGGALVSGAADELPEVLPISAETMPDDTGRVVAKTPIENDETPDADENPAGPVSSEDISPSSGGAPTTDEWPAPATAEETAHLPEGEAIEEVSYESKVWGCIFEDANADGIKNGDEPGINGIEVGLYTVGSGGMEALLSTTMTSPSPGAGTHDGNGYYEFSALPPGTYFVAVKLSGEQEKQYKATVKHAHGIMDATDDSDFNADLKTDVFTLDSSGSFHADCALLDVFETEAQKELMEKKLREQNAEEDLALPMDGGQGESAISGLIWYDANADGTQGETGTGIPAMTVILQQKSDDDSWEEAGRTITTANGEDMGTYSFSTLGEGTYRAILLIDNGLSIAAGSAFTEDVTGEIANGFATGEIPLDGTGQSGFTADCVLVTGGDSIIVYTYAELETILKDATPYKYIYLGADIDATAGFTIHASNTNITIDGCPPGENTRHTYHEARVGVGISRTGTVQTGAAMNLAIKNIILDGYDYYGTFNSRQASHFTYQNVSYTGPQMTYNLSGSCTYIDVDAHIVVKGSYACDEEFAELNSAEFGGTISIIKDGRNFHEIFGTGYSNSIVKILDGANVTISTGSNTSIPFITGTCNLLEIGNNVTLDFDLQYLIAGTINIGNNCNITATTDSYFGSANITAGDGNSFNLNAGAYFCGGTLTLGSGNSFGSAYNPCLLSDNFSTGAINMADFNTFYLFTSTSFCNSSVVMGSNNTFGSAFIPCTMGTYFALSTLETGQNCNLNIRASNIIRGNLLTLGENSAANFTAIYVINCSSATLNIKAGATMKASATNIVYGSATTVIIGEGAGFDATLSSGFNYGSYYITTMTVGENANVKIMRTAAHAAATYNNILRLTNSLTVGAGATFELYKNAGGAGGVIQTYFANSNITFNSPARVVLASPDGGVMQATAASGHNLHITTKAMNAWNTSYSLLGSIENTPDCIWNKGDLSSFTTNAVYQSASNTVHSISNPFTAEDRTDELTTASLPFTATTKLLTFGEFGPFSVDKTKTNSMAITGAAPAGYAVAATYLKDDGGIGTSVGIPAVISSGTFSLDVLSGDTLVLNSYANVHGYSNMLHARAFTQVVSDGKLSFEVPASLVFKSVPVSADFQTVLREDTDWTITVTDTRSAKTGWRLDASILSPLTATQDFSTYILPGVLVFAESDMLRTPLETPVSIYNASGGALKETTPISWSEKTGLLLDVPGFAAKEGVTYSTIINWVLVSPVE